MSAAQPEARLETPGQGSSSSSISPGSDVTNRAENEPPIDVQLDLKELRKDLLALTKKVELISSHDDATDASDDDFKPSWLLRKASTPAEKPDQGIQDGIRYRMRTYKDKGDSYNERDHIPKEEPNENVSQPYWLKCIDAKYENGEAAPSKIEVVICDTQLRDFMAKTVIGPYIEHTSKGVWQKKEVVLKPNFLPIVLNYTDLKNATENGSPYETTPENRQRLRKLLEMVRSKCDEQLFRPIDTGTIPDFRVPFSYLWRLFKPGNLIVSPWNSSGDLQVFKVHHFQSPTDGLLITAWTWDWDGDQLQRTLYEFRIPKYEDEDKYPAELTCYPIEFYEHLSGEDGKEKLKEKLRTRREEFRQFTFEQKSGQKVLHYNGDIITGFSDDSFYRSLRAELLDGTRSSAKKLGAGLKVHKVDEDIVLDAENYVRRYGGSRWLGIVEPSPDKLCPCQLCLNEETAKWAEALEKGEAYTYSDNDLLLPPRLSGYSLGRKEWCQFSLSGISVAKDLWPPTSRTQLTADDPNAENGLILPEGLDRQEHDDIRNMVVRHSQVMARPPEERVGDMIGGKGESLILLFHGNSGTGKTLYAEWLAKSSQRPLFKVGTADIGTDAARAERNLKDIFELAQIWGAVLLIDEADVLLDARGGQLDSVLSKNALVSVLLREVEYYKGILILTTNRVKAFDPAILSRIHHAVNFEETSPAQEKRIWKTWIDRLAEKGLSKDIESLESFVLGISKSRARGILSGREIRNVVIQAQTMAATDGKAINITRDVLNRAYEYRQNFKADTNEQRIESNSMHARRLNNQG